MLSIFSGAYWSSVCLLWRNVSLDLLISQLDCLIFLLNCMSCLYILKIKPLLVSSLANWASLIAQMVENPPAMQETLVQFLSQEDPLEKGKATHSSILGLPLWLSW